MNKSHSLKIMNKFLLLFMMTMTTLSFGQDKTIDGIKVLEGAGDIEGLGFYAVYQAEGEKGKYRNYTINMFDYEYNQIASEAVQMSKVTTLVSSETNNSHLALAFSDMKQKQVSIRSFDKEGNLAGELDLTDSKYPRASLYKTPAGFIIVNMVKIGGAMSAKLKYDIISVDNELNVNWQNSIEGETVREVVDVLASEEGVAIVYSKGKGMKKENYGQHLMRLSNDGEVIFDEVFANNYFYFPNKILLAGDETFIFGSYPKPGKSKPIGVFAIGYDKNGKQTSKEEIEYATEISPEIKDIMSEEDINMKESPQFIVNDAIKTDDGFYVITETIRLKPAVGVGVEISTGGSSSSLSVNTAFHMGDFIVLKLKSDLAVDRIKVVTKKKNKVVVQGAIFNVNQYHHVLKQNHVSNYQFWVENEAGNPSMVYTIRKNFRSNIQIGVVDVTTEERVSKTKPVDSELEKLKELAGFGVMKSKKNQLAVYVFKKRALSFYNLFYSN